MDEKSLTKLRSVCGFRHSGQHQYHRSLVNLSPSSARNLGIVFDSAFDFKSHISHISDMRRIRHFLISSVAETIAASLIGSKLDYCNSVLINVTEEEISKLQGVQGPYSRTGYDKS